jgi:transposase InsO family protein
MMDLHSRRMVGWATSNRLKRDLALRALNNAVALRNPPTGCIHHTDRGSQYCSNDYQNRRRELGFKVSMSGRGNCYDKPRSEASSVAAIETFFKTLKAELIWRYSWATRAHVSNALFHYINGFYNTRRKHSAIGGKSPVKFEKISA